MQKHYNIIGVGTMLFLWAMVAQAQSVVAPGFGHELQSITWQAWGFVGLYILAGVLARVNKAVKTQEVALTLLDVVTWPLVGILAGAAGFTICEYAKEITGWRIPDLMEGLVISVFAYNREESITLTTNWVRRILRIESAGTPPAQQ